MTEYPPATYPPPGAMSPPAADDSPTTGRATETAQAAKQAGADLAQTATDRAKDVGSEAGTQARDLLGEARGQLRQQAEGQHRSLVNNLRSLGDELGGMASGNAEPGLASEVVSRARDHAHGVADWLDRREPGDLVEELRSFARRRPGAFLIGAALAGVMAGRLTRGAVAAHSDDSDAVDAPTGYPSVTSPRAVPAHAEGLPR